MSELLFIVSSRPLSEYANSADSLDIFFIVACSILIIVICISSAFDERLRRSHFRTSKVRIEAIDYYKAPTVTLSEDKFDIDLELNC